MDLLASDDNLRIVIPALVALFFALLLAAPAVRLRLRTGKWGITLHEKKTPAQRVIGAAMALLLAAMAGWAVLVAALGPEALGTWRTGAAVRALGLALVFAGAIVTAIAQGQMKDSWRIGIDAERTALVQAGLFRVVRNPIFTGMMTSMAGIVTLAPSAWTVMALVNAVTVIAIQTRLEEEHLSGLHGEVYRLYMDRVGRFFPRLFSRGRGARTA
jgi:protein-S-isoprenylcysteine O-methyltransferase Ste14